MIGSSEFVNLISKAHIPGGGNVTVHIRPGLPDRVILGVELMSIITVEMRREDFIRFLRDALVGLGEAPF